MNDTLILERAHQLLDEKPHVMSSRAMSLFVKSCVDRKKIFLKLAEEYGSPLYIVDTRYLRQRVKQIKDVFGENFKNSEVFFAMKSNNMPEISEIVTEEGAGIDVSSGIELSQALATGNSKIVFSGPGKTDEELKLAAENADRVIVLMDSFGELERLDKIAGDLKTKVRTGIRLTTQPEGLWRKFGVPLTDLLKFFEKAETKKNILLEGIQFHTSWNMSPKPQQDFIKKLGAVLADFPAKLKKSIKFLDIGGGYWPEQGEWLRRKGTQEGSLSEILFPEEANLTDCYHEKSTRIELYAESIAQTLKDAIPESSKWTICAEPGRWLVHASVYLLMKVVDVKGKDIAITDAGTNSVGWERFENDYFPVINMSKPDIYEHPFYILGSLCTPHDVWGYSYHGKGIAKDDVLIVPHQGAYTYSLRQNFIKKLPKTVLVDEDIQTLWPDNRGKTEK